MNKARRAVLGVVVLGSMAAGGVVGATMLAPVAGNAATTGATGSTGATGATGTGTTFHSNEALAHEKTESAQREADEASGKAPHGDGAFHPNLDPAHEKAESAERAAQEAAGQRPSVP